MSATLKAALLLEENQVVDTSDGQVITLPCLVESATPLPTTSGAVGDAQVLTKCLPVLPGLFAPHPDTVNCPNATLRERHVSGVRSVHHARVNLIYRAPGPSDWILEEISQTEWLQTFTTADGKNNLEVWWTGKTADNGFFLVPAPNAKKLAIPAQKFFGKRVLRATGWMKYADWQAIRKNVRSYLYTINSTQWGDDATNDARGCWLFQSLTTRTNDLNTTKQIELYFLNDPRGHYPIGIWYDINGFHPAGGITESQLRGFGPPLENQVIMGNGLSMFSVYKENNFNNLFTFDPSMA